MSGDATVGVVDQTAAGASNTKPVRTREVRLVLNDGSLVTAELQVVAVADARGNLVNPDQSGLLGEIRDLLADIKFLFELKG